MNCDICGTSFWFMWTDTHGIGQCSTCGAPYTIYHYEDNQRTDKPPALIINEFFIEPCREYWQKHHKPMPSGCSFPGSSQELASAIEAREWHEYMEANYGNQIKQAKP